MYDYIRGQYRGLSDGLVVVEAAGIGWSLSLTPTSISGLPLVDDEVLLYAVHIQREDAQELYGFVTRFERAIFRRLMTVSGIGPKQSLRILSGLSPLMLVQAISSGDVRLLSSVPGLGKKTAEKLVFELQAKLDDLIAEAGLEAQSSVGSGECNVVSSLATDANAALQALGYSPIAARAAVQAALREGGEGETLEALITKALQHV